MSAGRFGGVQLHNHLQLFFLRVKALPVAGMHVFNVARAFDENGEPFEPRYEKSFGGFMETIDWYARAIGVASAREEG